MRKEIIKNFTLEIVTNISIIFVLIYLQKWKMFRIAPYKFMYKLNVVNNLSTLLINSNISTYLDNVYSSTWRPIWWKLAAYQIEGWQTIRLYLHFCANYKNDSSKLIISDIWRNITDTLSSDKTVLDDIFFIFTFSDRNINVNSRYNLGRNYRNWLLHIMYEWRINVATTILKIIWDRVCNSDIRSFSPLIQDKKSLRDIWRTIKRIWTESVTVWIKQQYGLTISKEIAFRQFWENRYDDVIDFFQEINWIIRDKFSNIADFAEEKNIVEMDWGYKRNIISDDELWFAIANLPEHIDPSAEQLRMIEQLKNEIIRHRSTIEWRENIQGILENNKVIIDTIINSINDPFRW